MPTRARTPPEVDDTREALLGAARDLLASEGPDALTVRRIADRAGCSTMGLYTHFGGKEGVVDALFVEGFHRLATTMSEPLTDDPLHDLRQSCAAYRRFALNNPTHYVVMFERHIPGFEPTLASMTEARGTLELLVARVQRCLDAGAIDPGHGDAESIAYGVWATGHGLMSLELHSIGARDDYASRYETTSRAMFSGLVQPPPL